LIPRIARLLARADTFDAKTSDRPSRNGLAVEIALSEIERGRGTQFDPDLAPAFVEMMSQRFQSLAA
jgi:HD-GYP domain-containing protein (c-di-GMP phosphodiesterase class II)